MQHRLPRFISLPLRLAVCLAIMSAGSVAANETELVSNGGFAETGSSGEVVGWSVPGAYAIDRAQADTAGACLAYVGTDPAAYELCAQNLQLQTGRRYAFSGRVLNGALQGAGEGVRLAIEWSGQGKWLGGQYLTLPRDATGWQRLSGVTPPLPENADRFSIICFLGNGVVGRAYWDDISVKPYQQGLLTNLRSDAYRDVGAGGQVSVYARLHARDYDVDRSQLEVTLEVVNAAGASEAVIIDRSAALAEAQWTFDASPLAPGDYILRASARLLSTGLVTTLERPYRRLAVPIQRAVSFDRVGRTLVDGQRYFPLGLYAGNGTGLSDASLAAYRDSPFNCIMDYDMCGATQAYQANRLDACHAAGLKLIFSLKDTFTGDPESGRTLIRNAVAAHRHHPALLAWYLADEEPMERIEEMRLHYQIVRDADPDHPCWEVFYQTELDERQGTYDILGTDNYPVRSRSGAIDQPWRMAQLTTAAAHPGPVWMVPQAHNLNVYDANGSLAPTLDEMRCMAWQCIAGGANGLVFYSFFDLQRDPAVPFAERWAEVKAVGQEIRDLQVMLLADPAPAGRITAASRDVAWRAYLHDGDLCLVIVNPTREPMQTQFDSDRALRPTATLHGRPFSDTGLSRTLAVDLLPLEVRVVRLSAGGVIGSGRGVAAAYFPRPDLTGQAVNRIDATIAFDWAGGMSVPGFSADGFSVRWTGRVQAQFSETYTFSTWSDDGVRLWVDGRLLVDNWADHGATEDRGSISLVAGQHYDMRMEYYENGGDALAKLLWSSASTPQQVVPSSQLYLATGSVAPELGWASGDIGQVDGMGSAGYADGIWTVTGSGADIWNTADEFQFAWKRISGDVQITAKVLGLTSTHPWAKAGVMIRESLTPGSRHASTFMTAGNGVCFQRRTVSGTGSGHTAGPQLSAPAWVRLERTGNVLISSTSSDGQTWIQIRRETVSMHAALFVGLAVTSHSDGRFCTATFSDVQVVGAAAASN